MSISSWQQLNQYEYKNAILYFLKKTINDKTDSKDAKWKNNIALTAKNITKEAIYSTNYLPKNILKLYHCSILLNNLGRCLMKRKNKKKHYVYYNKSLKNKKEN
jgi:hypothetical protein